MNVERGCGADSPKHGQENGLQVLLLNATGEKLRLEVFPVVERRSKDF